MLKNIWHMVQDRVFLVLSPILGIIIFMMFLSALGKEMSTQAESDDP